MITKQVKSQNLTKVSIRLREVLQIKCVTAYYNSFTVLT